MPEEQGQAQEQPKATAENSTAEELAVQAALRINEDFEKSEGEEQPAKDSEPEKTKVEPKEPSQAEKRLHKLKVKAEDGADEEIEVDDEELQRGYMKDRDYRSKTAQLAAERKAIREHITKEVQERQKALDEKLTLAEQAIWHSLAPDLQSVDWNALARDDPAQWAQKMQSVNNANALLQRIQNERAQQAQAREAEIKSHMKQAAEDAVAVLQKELPSWNNELYSQILDAGRSNGFKSEEVNAITDPRAIKVLWKAMQYDALQKAKPAVEKKVAEVPKVAKPGTTEAPTDKNAKAWNEGVARLRKTGKPDDAVALAAMILERDNRVGTR